MNERHGTSEKEEVLALKAEVYDLSKTVNQQGSLLVSVCEALGLSVQDGIQPEDLINKINELRGE